MNFSSPTAFIFIGRSGCGKGTQAKLLIDYLKQEDPGRNILYLYAGDAFRRLAEGATLTGRKVKEVTEAGGRAPDFLAIWTWSLKLIESWQGGEHLVFDGSPRSLNEAAALDTALKFYGYDETWVIFLDVSNEWSIARLTARGRVDDELQDIKNRLAWFEKDVQPAVKFYETAPGYRFLRINGEQTIEKVHADIVAAV